MCWYTVWHVLHGAAPALPYGHLLLHCLWGRLSNWHCKGSLGILCSPVSRAVFAGIAEKGASFWLLSLPCQAQHALP